MATVDELFDSLMNNCKKPEDLIGEKSLLNQLLRTTLHLEKRSGLTVQQVSPEERLR